MAGITLLLDLFKKNPNFSIQSLHSYGLFSATAAASAAAASITAGRPFASRFLFGDGGTSVAFCDCDVSPAWTEDYIANLHSASKNIFQNDSLKYSTKEYPIELKPLFSAFGLKTLAITSLRSFLFFYLPLLEPHTNIEDDDDFLQDDLEVKHIDLIVPLKKSVKQIIRETTVVTTRRVLERLALHYVSQRVAWKLLKGHFLGVAASWIVQVGIEIHRCFSYKVANGEHVDMVECVKILRKKVSGATIRCGSSLAFASIGAGIGTMLLRPSVGQWIGCTVGDIAGPVIVAVCLKKVLPLDI
ncbi:uncharacterized protein LOC131229441 isoform X2 [Magnolia sinica]|uniref:uncharacterized protein LOC131229441 isoform X2 n=1 Tax=Magnolia sinica TaxID=86752 RepID=UPI0026598FF4|nr:uncharacterized protein LOC131229441 isoform X2 [Magnolia sinica]